MKLPHPLSFNKKPIQKLHTLYHTLHFADLMPLENIDTCLVSVCYLFYHMVTMVFSLYPVPALHIVFGPDLNSVEVDVGVIVLCVHNISCTPKIYICAVLVKIH